MEAKEKWDQLTEQHRGQLLERHRDAYVHDEWWDDVYEVFKGDMSAIGVHVETIYFSGFWSQGDGACFEAHYRYRKGAPKALRDYAPHDEALHRIADALQVVQRRNFFQLRAEATHGGRYYHEYCMSISVDRDSPTWQPMTDGAEEAVTEALRDLARWLYRQLEREYEHLTSDEAIDESIAANDYTFTEAGCRFG